MHNMYKNWSLSNFLVTIIWVPHILDNLSQICFTYNNSKQENLLQPSPIMESNYFLYQHVLLLDEKSCIPCPFFFFLFFCFTFPRAKHARLTLCFLHKAQKRRNKIYIYIFCLYLSGALFFLLGLWYYNLTNGRSLPIQLMTSCHL